MSTRVTAIAEQGHIIGSHSELKFRHVTALMNRVMLKKNHRGARNGSGLEGSVI